LAILALGRIRDAHAVPCLLAVLQERDADGYAVHGDACIALARIRSTAAISVLEDYLRASDSSYALPEAFRALITLGDRQAVPLAIARISPGSKDQSSGFIVGELEKVTGQRFGFHRQRSQAWWRQSRVPAS
jgi:HEAT repeat protein